jgi:hypothetical protein
MYSPSKSSLDLVREISNGIGVPRQVRRPIYLVHTIDGEHLERTDFVHRVRADCRRAFDADHAVLAIADRVGVLAARVVVGDEEGIEACAVEENV